MIELYVIEKYKEIYPELSGSELTNTLVLDCLHASGLDDMQVKRTEKGKPYAERRNHAQGGLEIHLSVSHSGIFFVCAVADRMVGVDIQEQRKVNVKGISRRYFSQGERAYIEAHGEKGFFTIWTRKEAYSKYTGLGLEEIMKGTDVLDRQDIAFLDFQLEDGMYCSCCIMKGNDE